MKLGGDSFQSPEQVFVNGEPPVVGEHQVKRDGEGTGLELRLLRKGKIVNSVRAHRIELWRKEPQDSPLIQTDRGDTSPFEIHFSGTEYCVFVGDNEAGMNATENDIRYCHRRGMAPHPAFEV
jgi:hypothetical protein